MARSSSRPPSAEPPGLATVVVLPAPPRHPATNLPTPVTPFLGRTAQVAQVTALLERPALRLLTLTGPPGVGKTRLALQVASELVAQFADGITFVAAASVTTAGQLYTVIAQTLHLREVGPRSLAAALAAHLRDKQLLLLLDNLEQVPDSPAVIAPLLAAAPGLKVLTTSRVRLHIYGEHECPVPPLALPDLNHLPDLAILAQQESVALFLQCAHAVDPTYGLTAATAPIIAAICARLEGLPLAIELAAARSTLFTPQAMLAHLEPRLDFLKGGARDLPRRQQTLRDALTWSYDLLPSAEQRLFRRLAVFVGGWTLDAAQAVCAAAGDLGLATLDGVEALLHHSLIGRVAVEPGAAQDRFSMLELIREYALEQLVASGEAATLQERHARYFQSYAAQEATGAGSSASVRHLQAAQPNLRAALTWCSQSPDGGALGLQLAVTLAPFWKSQGYLSHGRAWLTRMLACAPPTADPVVRAQALWFAGHLAALQGAHDAAAPLLAESLHLWQALDHPRWVSCTLLALGHGAIHAGDPVAAHRYYAESLALCQAADDPLGIARSWACLADWAIHTGETGQAHDLYEAALALARPIVGDNDLAPVLLELCTVLIAERDYSRATTLATECLQQFQALDDTLGIAYCLGVWGHLAFVQSHAVRAVRIFAGAQTWCDRVGIRLEPPVHTDRTTYTRALTELHTRLGPAAFTAAWQQGRTLQPGELLAGQQPPGGSTASRSGAADAGPLTARELEVLRLVALGMTNAQAGHTLTISPYTINMHLRAVYSKLGVSSRSAAIQHAMHRQLL